MKKHFSKKLLAVTTAILIAFTSLESLPVSAKATESVSTASGLTKSDWISGRSIYKKSSSTSSLQTRSKTQNNLHKTGYVDPGFAMPSFSTKTQTNSKTYQATSLPTSYDLRNENKVTSVKDQSTSGCCWAFAAIGSLESALMPTENRDFSENNLKNNSGFDLDPNTGGGNDYMSLAYFTRWSGPVNETDDPYDPNSTQSPTDKTVQKHLQNAEFIPSRFDENGNFDNTALKEAVMKYGAVSVSMFMDGWYDELNINNGTTNTYYYSQNDEFDDHAVDIVGWDDSYPASKFCDYDNNNAQPAGNGAFIVKNSWGSSWGDNGYFYVSYYDPLFADETNTVYYDAQSANNYLENYQYDPLGFTNYWYDMTDDPTEVWMSNVFTANSSNQLAATSFYTYQSNVNYTVYANTNYTGTSSLSSNLTEVASGSFADAGFHTVPFSTKLSLTSGKKFAVVVKLTTTSDDNPVILALEEPDSGYSSQATASPGESYLSGNGSTWTDLTTCSDGGWDDFSNSNVCLKAYTVAAVATPVSISMKSSPTKTTYVQGQSLDLTGAAITVHYSDNSTKDVSVTSSMVSGYNSNTLGKQTIKVTYDGFTTSFQVTVVAKAVSSISMKSSPTKTTYVQGQSLDVTGAVITAHYNDNSTKDVSVTSSMVSGYNSKTVGTQTVQVTYAGKTASFQVKVLQSVSVTYQAHVQKIGWMSPVSNGAIAGTVGKSLRVEALKIDLSGAPAGLHIEYRAHVQKIGWQNWTEDGAIAGTTGKGLRVEAIEIKLVGTNAAFYSVEYQAQVQNIGWQSWVKDGELAGTSGQGLRMEALRIKVAPKIPTVTYQSHVQRIGWQNPVSDGATSGTTGKGLRVEAVRIQLSNAPAGLHIQYRAHVQKLGWQNWTEDDAIAGTTGQGLRVEAIEIKLVGTDAASYSIQYQAHVQGIGWQNWVSDGALAGTTGQGRRIEALRIDLIAK